MQLQAKYSKNLIKLGCRKYEQTNGQTDEFERVNSQVPFPDEEPKIIPAI